MAVEWKRLQYAFSDLVETDEVRARSASGLKLYDDDGNGIFVEDGGQVGIGTATPGAKLHVYGNSVPGANIPTSWGFLLSGSNSGNRSGWVHGDKALYLNVFGGSGYGELSTYDYGISSAFKFALNANGGNVGIGNTSASYKLDVSGTGRFTGAVTTGGSDPPYEVFWAETRESVMDRIKRNVPPMYLNGCAIFYNSEADRMELFLPSKGEFRDLQNNVLETVDPIPAAFPTKKTHVLDTQTGRLLEFDDPAYEYSFDVREGCRLDVETGKYVDENDQEVPEKEAVVFRDTSRENWKAEWIKAHTTETEIPAEDALEPELKEVEDTTQVLSEKQEYYLDNGEVKSKIVTTYKKKLVDTGKKKLKSGVRFDTATGKFYKPNVPTETEAEAAAETGFKMEPPSYVQDRVSELIGKVTNR